MKLQPSLAAGRNVVTAYGDGYVAVNGERRESSMVLMPDRILDWEPERFEALAEEHFAALLELGVEIVLLGTGPKQRFPHPRLTAALSRAGIGLEVMDLQAACRTYNILVSEERKVAAALLFG